MLVKLRVSFVAWIFTELQVAKSQASSMNDAPTPRVTAARDRRMLLCFFSEGTDLTLSALDFELDNGFEIFPVGGTVEFS